MKTSRFIAAMALMAAISMPAFSSTPVKQTTLSTQTTSVNQKRAGTVYVTKKGKKFHKANCKKLVIKQPVSMKRYKALELGYRPCKKCNP